MINTLAISFSLLAIISILSWLFLLFCIIDEEDSEKTLALERAWSIVGVVITVSTALTFLMLLIKLIIKLFI